MFDPPLEIVRPRIVSKSNGAESQDFEVQPITLPMSGELSAYREFYGLTYTHHVDSSSFYWKVWDKTEFRQGLESLVTDVCLVVAYQNGSYDCHFSKKTDSEAFEHWWMNLRIEHQFKRTRGTDAEFRRWADENIRIRWRQIGDLIAIFDEQEAILAKLRWVGDEPETTK